MDLCILLGCDYTETIRGVGPKSAYNLIKEHKTIDEAIKHLTPKLKDNIPADWNYADARELFVNPEVTPGDSFDVNISERFSEGGFDILCYFFLVGLERA